MQVAGATPKLVADGSCAYIRTVAFLFRPCSGTIANPLLGGIARLAVPNTQRVSRRNGIATVS